MMAAPWIAHGETALLKDGGYVVNPTPFNLGLVGAVTSLPYTVPAGKQLIIDYFSIEGIWGAAMWPWIGALPFDGSKVIQTFTAPDLNIPFNQGPLNDGSKFGQLPGTREWHPCFVLPAETIFNLTLAGWHQSSEGWVYGWVVSGELQDVVA